MLPTAWPLERASELTGVPAEAIRETAHAYGRADRAQIEERRGGARPAVEHEGDRAARGGGVLGDIGGVEDRGRALARLVEQRERSGGRHIGELAAANEVQAVIFFRDPLLPLGLESESQETDFAGLLQVCDEREIPLATNRAARVSGKTPLPAAVPLGPPRSALTATPLFVRVLLAPDLRDHIWPEESGHLCKAGDAWVAEKASYACYSRATWASNV